MASAAGDDPIDSTAGEKQPLNINYDALLSASADDPAANLVVVSSADRRKRRRDTAAENPGDELLSQKSDGELKEQIERLKKLIPGVGRNLADKGEKLKLELGRVVAELDRRLLRKTIQVADGCKNPEAGHRKFNGESDWHKREAPASQTSESSVFASRFMKKLESDAKPESEQNTSVKGRNAFQDEMSHIRPCDKQKKDAGGKVSVSKKAKPGIVGKDFQTWSYKNGSRSKQNYGQLDGFLTSRQEKPPNTFTAKNDSKCLGSESANDDKEECTVVLVDEEEPEVIERIQGSERRRSRRNEWKRNECKIFYPSREDPDSLEIFRSELKCLEPGECLTSTIMNFYIRFLQQQCSTSDTSKQKFYFFNTYFYSKLQEAVARQNEESFFIKFRRWWKGVNIFEKTYIFLPVNEDKHWSLVIICTSDEEDLGPVILHLDSLGLHSSRSIFGNVRSLLENEWKYLKEDGETVVAIPDTLKENLPEKIDAQKIEAPRQTNDYDCGLFVLYYIERFIQNAPERMKEEHFSQFGKKWFKPQDASSLRGRIKKILWDEFQKAPMEDTPVFEPVCLPPKLPRDVHRVNVL